MSQSFYHRYCNIWGLLCCFLIPLKLSLTYICLLPLLLLFLISGTQKSELANTAAPRLFLPFLLFLCAALVTGFFGIHPLHSATKILELGFLSFAILLFAHLSTRVGFERMILALCAGHLIAGSYAVVRAAFQDSIDEVFIGPVTQSGQLACSFVLALGLAFYSYARTKESRPLPLKNAGFGCLICCLFTLIAFGNFSGPLLYTLIALLSTLMLFGLFACGKLIFAQKINYSSIGGTLIIYVLPILFANLLANLKRGPWLGVVLGVCLMTLLVTGKRFYSCIPIALAIGSLAIQPVYQRIIHSYDHFFITGGRHLLWQIGIELSTRFPLGIGYDNSRIVKTFSPNIPHELEHFHNNMINLLVETGYVGLCLFAWWLLSIWRFSFSTKRKIEQIVPISIGCAILSWQIAGIVEYNVGDSEITILIFLLIGLLLGSKRAQGQPTAL